MMRIGQKIADISDEATFRETWQREMRTPVVTSIFILVTIFFVVFLVRPRFGIPIWPYGILLTLVWTFIYYMVFYAFYWRVMRSLAKRNVPLLMTFLGYFFGLAILEYSLAPIYLPVTWEAERAIWYFSTSIAVFPAATAICMLVYERPLREGFAKVPAALPYWRPVPARIDRLSHRLPPEKRGRLRRIEARNQYVEVTTDQGPHILRMTLQDAIDATVCDGLQIHRSIWLADDEIQELIYENGNPKVVDTRSQVWPAGRKKVAAIRKTLVERAS